MNDSYYPHLSKATVNVLKLNDDERINWVNQPRWIGYDAANFTLNRLKELYEHPKVTRMPNLLILGHTNNGKTTIAKKMANLYPPDDSLENECIRVPIMMIQAPPLPDESRLYNIILDKLFAPYKITETVSRKQSQVIRILRKIETKMLIIDEIQHIIAGPLEKQRQFLNVIKYIGNELQIPIVGLGTKEALRAIHTDPQMGNRFEPIAIPKWELNKDYQKLLVSFESILPLKYPSNLHHALIAKRLYGLSEGIIGELSTLLNRAAIEAIKSGEEKISIELIERLTWIAPSNRRRHIESLL